MDIGKIITHLRVNNMHIFNFIIALLVAFLELYLLYQRVYKKMVQLGKIFDHPEWEYDKCVMNLLHFREIATYTIVTMGILAIGFVGLYVLSIIPMQSVIVDTGIHIPFILAIMGMLIKHISSLIVKDYIIDGRNIILICSLVLTCSVGVLDWKLCLLILAVIMGKFIWIDFVFEFEEIRDEIRKIVNMIRHDIGVEYMAFHLSMWFLGLFIGFTIMYLSFMKSAPEYMIFVYLLSLISVDISNSSQSNVDNLFFNNEEVKKTLKRIKDKHSDELEC